jgi:hypothetical protein
MIMVAIGSALVGAVFGQRFKVLALLPINLFFIACTGVLLVVDVLSATTALWAVLAHVLPAQLGYLGGLFLRYVLVASRVPSRLSGSSSPARL